MTRALLISLAALCLAAPVAQASERPPGQYLPGEVIVRYQAATQAAERDTIESEAGTVAAEQLPGGATQLQIQDSESVRATLAELEDDPRVEYAVPNYVAHASSFTPNDPGFPLQWNFWGPFGINMPDAWALASRRGAPGGRGVVVAVLDSGVAYRTFGALRRAPDLRSFVRGYDFVEGDPVPLDMNGHGTHVAGTIAEATNNRLAAAGIAYGARVMPVRVLDARGAGDVIAISRGIRYAARHGADVVNLSLEFAPFVTAAYVPDLLAALRYAHHRGVVVTAVAGNGGAAEVPYPARAPGVITVAATTERGCAAEYSNSGAEIDVAAPGGGDDAAPGANPWDAQHCQPGIPGRSIYQQTFDSTFAGFGLPEGYYGTSMASPHVAGLAALIIGSRRLGRHPRPGAVERLIERTARDTGAAGFDPHYGHGVIDAAAALR